MSSPRFLGLHSLLLTSRRLYKLVRPFVYRRVFVRGGDESSQLFYDKVVRNPELLDRLNRVIVGCTGVDTFKLSRKLFWARSLYKLTLVEFDDWIYPRVRFDNDYSDDNDNDDDDEDEDEDENEDLIETSPLQYLELMRCSADGAALSNC
ncbi:hypothetical protein ASPCAL13013 [Aspergillus calidoustus]|uniref:Uncharacterized protein n=1 Tax=Aspergillus calidoustus TaxID=454130 RepID=A0A0U5GFL3_ASPCI|nr:hypothetical protein ASPCAL13013 [Aspergillus calidoustus]